MSRPCDWGMCNEKKCSQADECLSEIEDWKETDKDVLSERERREEFLVGTGLRRSEAREQA